MKRLISLFIIILAMGAFTAFAQDEPQDNISIEAGWNEEILVLINSSDFAVNLSGLLLLGGEGEIAAGDWELISSDSGEAFTLERVPAGACVVAHQGDERPELPEGINCDLVIAQFIVAEEDDLIWQQDEFIPFVANVEREACPTADALCSILVPLAGEAEPETTDIRAVWTLDIFVLINTGDNGADLSSLRLVSQLGEISPDEWEMEFSQEDGRLFTVDDMRPGSCLIAYIGSNRPNVPETVSCSRIMGRYTIESFEDVVWGIPQGGFTPYIGDAAGEACSIQRTSCDITVPNADAETEEEVRDTASDGSTVRAIWNEDIFVLINVGEHGIDISNLSFTSALGEILPDNWLLNAPEAGSSLYTLENMRPGSCLLAFLDTTRVEVPDEVNCSRIMGEYAILLPGNLVWSVSQGGFTPYVGNTAGVPCSVVRSSCDIQVPTSAD